MELRNVTKNSQELEPGEINNVAEILEKIAGVEKKANEVSIALNFLPYLYCVCISLLAA